MSTRPTPRHAPAPPAPARGVRTPIPGPKTAALLASGQLDMQAIYRLLVVDDEASQGCSLVDADGNVFLDLFSHFALGALGYNHPALLEVARSPEFVRAVANPTSSPFVPAPQWLSFLDGMTRYAPHGMSHIYCVDAGGEGVEAALKAGFIVHGERRRSAAGGPRNPLELPAADQEKILMNAGSDAVAISLSGAFHGRGFGSLAATHSKTIHKADIPSFDWPVAPFPANRHPRHRYAEENSAVEAAALAELERIFDRYDGRVASLIVEPMQSEGGDRHASPAFFQGVQRLCKQANAAFILDEVQTGMGISGTLWTHEQLDLPTPPDMVAFGKKMQMGGFFASDAYTIRQFGRMYQTRNGDRARAMLALATLRTIEAEHLLQNVRDVGALLLARLEELSDRFPSLITEPRGRGFLMAFDLPTTAARDELLKRAMRRGVFATYTGVRSVRLRPHLIMGAAEANEAADVFHAVAAEMVG